MSFFRVLLALLISGGIAYGLYHVVTQQKASLSSGTGIVAERADIADSTAQDETTNTGAGVEAEPEQTGETDASASDQGETGGLASFAERTAEAVAETGQELVDDVKEAVGLDETSEADAESSDADAAPQPEGEGDAETGMAQADTELPATAIATDTSESIAALQIVSGGMTYSKARETLLDAGWTPRALTERDGTPDATETALVDAGYTELEGCSGAERAICRFEFLDGEKRRFGWRSFGYRRIPDEYRQDGMIA
jgi:hypothetical protein